MAYLWNIGSGLAHMHGISSEEVGPGINRTLTTGTLSRDVRAHGPKIDFGYFFVCHVRLGVLPFFGNRNLFQKKLGPKKFIRDKSGDNSL